MRDGNILTARLGPSRAAVDITLAQLTGENVIRRIWQGDRSLWPSTGTEGLSQSGWQSGHDLPEKLAAEYNVVLQTLRDEGIRQVVWLGMGTTSAAARLYQRALAPTEHDLAMVIVDTVDPGVVRRCADSLVPEETLWVVASQNGRTEETLALLRYFFGRATDALGRREVGRHFLALTPEGTPLSQVAEEWHFRPAPWKQEDNGPRGALSPSALFAAACLGLDLPRLGASARAVAHCCGPDVPISENPAAFLGTVLGELARQGRDKLVLVPSAAAIDVPMFEWVGQAVAGATGKEAYGIVPVQGAPFEGPTGYGADSLFAAFCPPGDADADDAVRRLAVAGHPVVHIPVDTPYDLGGHVMLWDLAAAVAGHCLRVDPWERKGMEAIRRAAHPWIRAFKETGNIPTEPPLLADGVLSYYAEKEHLWGDSPMDALQNVLERQRPPGYVAIFSYLEPLPAVEEALERVRSRIRAALGVPVVVGHGPQLLRSLAQLHMGNSGRGLFLQLTADHEANVPIPDEMGFSQGVVSFGALQQALALGQEKVLRSACRTVVRIHLGANPDEGLSYLSRIFAPRRTSSIPPQGGSTSNEVLDSANSIHPNDGSRNVTFVRKGRA